MNEFESYRLLLHDYSQYVASDCLFRLQGILIYQKDILLLHFTLNMTINSDYQLELQCIPISPVCH